MASAGFMSIFMHTSALAVPHAQRLALHLGLMMLFSHLCFVAASVGAKISFVIKQNEEQSGGGWCRRARGCSMLDSLAACLGLQLLS